MNCIELNKIVSKFKIFLRWSEAPSSVIISFN